MIVLAALLFAIKLWPAIVFAEADVHLECIVPKAVENRALLFGIQNWTASGRNLDGDQAPAVFELVLHHAPCEAGDAFCEVLTASGSLRRITAPFQVVGCG